MDNVLYTIYIYMFKLIRQRFIRERKIVKWSVAHVLSGHDLASHR